MASDSGGSMKRRDFLAGAGVGYHADANYWDGITNMITLWQRMGFVVRQSGVTDPDAPAQLREDMFVEMRRSNMEMMFDWNPSEGVLPEN